jgi:hypothetical protein
MTRILIVSDGLERSREMNQRLVTELKQLKVDFSVTEPVEVAGNAASQSDVSLRGRSGDAWRC